MADSFNLPNPVDGNNILRSGTGAFYGEKAYFIPPTNLDIDVLFPSTDSAPRIIAETDGSFRLQGIVSVTGISLSPGTRIFDIPSDLGGINRPRIPRPIAASTQIASGLNAAQRKGMILNLSNSSNGLISAEVRYLGLTEGAISLTSGDEIFLDFIILIPQLINQ